MGKHGKMSQGTAMAVMGANKMLTFEILDILDGGFH